MTKKISARLMRIAASDFGAEEVAGFMSAAGLDVSIPRDLTPEAGEGGKLTVSLWLGAIAASSPILFPITAREVA